jgi:hypothetical protein
MYCAADVKTDGKQFHNEQQRSRKIYSWLVLLFLHVLFYWECFPCCQLRFEKIALVVKWLAYLFSNVDDRSFDLYGEAKPKANIYNGRI